MNNECGALYYNATGLKHTCNLVSNHEGSHYDYKYRRTWPRSHPYSGWFEKEYKTGVLGQFNKPGVLEFTAHELAELYVILSGNHDIPEVYLNKIGAALKEML